MIYRGISLLVNTRRLEIILKYFNFIKSLERVFIFKPPPRPPADLPLLNQGGGERGW